MVASIKEGSRMKLYYGPGACSLGIHLLMEEIGKPYEGVAVSLRQGEQFQEGFTSVNPKSKVPTLVRDDGSVLTEFPAIAYWLARTYPSAKLLPDDLEEQTRALEALDYVVATIHMQGASRLFRPSNFTPSASDEEKVKARGREIFERGLANIDKAISGKDYVVGSYSIADAALFYAEYWAANPLKLALPENCARHYKTMMGRPAVQRTLKAEGLTT
jgi:glutathione S-transferase